MANKLVTIRHFAYGSDPASEAELARIKLEANGIRCFLAGKNFISMYWILSSAERGIKLQVRESDAEKASEILGLIEEARREGLDVTADSYPYTAGFTEISILLPARFKRPEGGHRRPLQDRRRKKRKQGFHSGYIQRYSSRED